MIIPLIVGKILPYFGGDQRITHMIELNPHSHYITMMNKNEMIHNLEEDIIMKYQWHSHKHGYTDALIAHINDVRKEEVTSVSLSK